MMKWQKSLIDKINGLMKNCSALAQIPFKAVFLIKKIFFNLNLFFFNHHFIEQKFNSSTILQMFTAN